MKTMILALAIAAGITPAAAQTAAPTQSTGTARSSPLGGLSGLIGGGLPNVSATGAGNAAGVLGYCVKNNVLSGANATSVLGRLTGQGDVARTPGYAAGQNGVLQTGNGQTLSLAGLKGQVKTRVCDLVLRRAASFL